MVNNILIIGITGNGKSALASLLANNNEFKESSSGTSETSHFQVSKEPFEYEGKKYRLIDNIGFGDNKGTSEEEIFLEIGEGIYSAKEGINQILFVFGGRFGPEQVEVFKKFKSFVSGNKINEIAKFTTLVRTNFPNFRDQESCDEDRQSLLDEDNKDLSEAIESCSGVIYIDNPPIPEVDDADSDDEAEIELVKEKKEASRKIVLDYLAKNCGKPYEFGEWNAIYKLVDDYINKKKEKSEVIRDIKIHLAKELLTSSIEQKAK